MTRRNATALSNANAIAFALMMASFYFLAVVLVKADDVERIDPRLVQNVADRIGVLLLAHGFERINTHGLPPAVITDVPPLNGEPLAARVFEGRIEIDANQPRACLEHHLIHELSHVLIAKAYGAVGHDQGLPNAIASIMAQDEFTPNCGRAVRPQPKRILERVGQ